MKKIFAISLIAMSAVTAANAEIASKAYVNAEDTKITNTIGELSGLSQGITKTSVVAAINSVAENAGSNVSGLDQRLNTLEAGEKTSGSVDYKIANALQYYTKTGEDTTYATQSDFTKLDDVVRDQTTGLAATKSIADANKSAIENQTTGLAATKAIADANATAITAIEGSAYATSGITSAKVSDYDAAVSAVNNQTTGLAATNTLAVAALPKTEAASTYQTLANISTNMTTDTGSDTKYPSVAAVEAAIGTVNTAASGLDTRLTTAEGKITAIEGSAYATSGITSAKVSDYDAAVSAVNNASTGLAATKTIADANATAITTLNGDASTTGSVANKIAAAQATLQDAIDGKVGANTAITASSGNSIVQYDAKGLVVSGTPAGALATKSIVGRDDINANAVTLEKLSATLPSPCQQSGTDCVLKSANGELGWEVIQR